MSEPSDARRKRCLAEIQACLTERCVDALYFEHAKKLFFLLRESGHYESLVQLVKHGPVWDGDVISKTRRDDLIKWGLAVRCCYKGEQGYTAASYYSYTIVSSEDAWLEDSFTAQEPFNAES